MQRQVNRHARNNGSKHAAAPVKPGGASNRGKQPCVFPGANEMAVGHDNFGHDDRGQSRDGCIVQPALGPARQGPRLARQKKEGAREDGHKSQADDGDHRPEIGLVHAVFPVSAVSGVSAVFWILDGSGFARAGFSSIRHTATAAAMATRMLSLSGNAKAATAAAPATPAETARRWVLANEPVMPSSARMPANPSPHSSGME